MIRFKRNDYFYIQTDENEIENIFYKILEEEEKGKSGYYYLSTDSKNLIKELENLNINVNTIVVIGIGGSSLGTKAIYNALNIKNLKEIIFLENPDPIFLEEELKKINKEEALFIVVSKSGKTIETISIFKLILDYFDLDLQRNSDKFIFISDENSPLCNLGDENGIKVFTIPKNVGGRFSVFSAVGIVPLFLAGVDVKKLLLGADEIKNRFFEKKEFKIIKKALFLVKNYKKYCENVLFAYSNYLEDFGKWYVQLIAESLGKKKDNEYVGITPIVHLGAVDQHSFLQLIMEGPRNKTITFLKVLDFKSDLRIPNISLKGLEFDDFVNGRSFNELINKEADATYEAISEEGIPAEMIEIDSLNEKDLGELIMYYFLLTSCMGIVFGIDTYNQPGVERGKQILKEKF